MNRKLLAVWVIGVLVLTGCSKFKDEKISNDNKLEVVENQNSIEDNADSELKTTENTTIIEDDADNRSSNDSSQVLVNSLNITLNGKNREILLKIYGDRVDEYYEDLHYCNVGIYLDDKLVYLEENMTYLDFCKSSVYLISGYDQGKATRYIVLNLQKEDEFSPSTDFAYVFNDEGLFISKINLRSGATGFYYYDEQGLEGLGYSIKTAAIINHEVNYEDETVTEVKIYFENNTMKEEIERVYKFDELTIAGAWK